MNNNYPTAETYIRYNTGRIIVEIYIRYNTRSKPMENHSGLQDFSNSRNWTLLWKIKIWEMLVHNHQDRTNKETVWYELVRNAFLDL